QGKSLYDLCTGKADPHQHKDYAYTEYYVGQPFHKALRTQPLVTMIRSRTHKIAVYAGIEQGELYDLKADPDEFDNLWDSPAHKDLKHDLVKMCFDASVCTTDPLPERVADW
ncbi:MAG: DUF4976 domain-containing protein, partial [Armatimonadetes bacterium]|nr:DUF4976 domain-containing protein [Armatimonadota bacterium]